MEIRDVLGLFALAVAALSLLNTVLQRRSDTGNQQLIQLRKEYDTRLMQLHQATAELTAAVHQVKLEQVQTTVNVPTREQLDEAIDRALGPVLNHMRKTERFIEQIYQSGLLVTRKGER